MFGVAEKDRRLKAADDMMRTEGLRAMLIVGNSVVGVRAYGCYRYFVDSRVSYHMDFFVKTPGEELTVCVGSQAHVQKLRESGFTT